CRACGPAAWFGVPGGSGRLTCAELTDSQSLSLVVSREPAVGGVTDLGGSGAMDSVGTECRSAEVPGLWSGCLVQGACQEQPDIP
ncbi:MAG TPA: hypothetical protein VGD71_28590, partial [Kribbella sp.]